MEGVGSMRVWGEVFWKYRRVVEGTKRVLEMDDKNKGRKDSEECKTLNTCTKCSERTDRLAIIDGYS